MRHVLRSNGLVQLDQAAQLGCQCFLARSISFLCACPPLRANLPPIEAFGGNEQNKVGGKSSAHHRFVGDNLVGIAVVKAE